MYALPERKSLPKVKDIADTTFVSLDEDTLIAVAAKALYEREGCSIIVTKTESEDAMMDNSRKRRPVGIVTERDMIFRVIAQNKGPFKVMLKDIMSSPLVTIGGGSPLKEAISIMKKRNINRLPVLDKHGELVGLITTQMIMRKALFKEILWTEA